MRIPPVKPDEVCLGAALLVPDPLAAKLRQARRSFGDADASPPHITVIPPTPVPADGVAQVVDRISRRAAGFGPFTVRLRGAATFRPVSPVVYARLEEGFERCQALEALLRDAVTGLEDRFPYQPHVTVANGCADAVLSRAEAALSQLDAAFRVDTLDVSLLRPDGAWQPVRRLPLASVEVVR
ncbi:MAG: 2'-5' RNA ligase family protein [Bifidobacteriaceae bacterium]|nr:2'-5' RNA ligase family protein [Bifidobacteriaceae bacterium]